MSTSSKKKSKAQSKAKSTKGTKVSKDAKVSAKPKAADQNKAAKKSKGEALAKKAAAPETAKKANAAQDDAPRGFVLANDLSNFTSVTALEPSAKPGFSGKKAEGEAALAAGVEHLSELQERLWAQNFGTENGRRILLVVQGMDTSGKGGIMRHVVGAVDPQGVSIKAFKAPTPTEKNRHFLWRIRRALPEPGMIGVFDRSHYEDVLIHRVHGWANEATLTKRYADINRFEKQLVEERGYEVVKVMLHISRDEQWERLYERLGREDKHWKFNTSDLDEREHWGAYMDAYDAAIRETHTEWAPWHVIPADRKWYARLAVQGLLTDALERISPAYPAADFDVEAAKARMLDDAPESMKKKS